MLKKLPLIGAMFVALTVVEDGAAAANPQVLIKTSMGEIVVELYPDKAPKSVENFLQYVRDGHYNGTVFHRVIGNFMIQGGGFTPDFYKPGTPDFGQKKTRAPIPLESKNGLRNDAGWLAMARTSAPDSATAQFFINTVDNANLNHPQPDGHGYAVFGKVIKGMEAVNAIKAVKTGRMGPFGDVPAEPVTIESVSVVGGR
ncbi:peptidylprolyl isomerase [Quisquiliibacterium transsilvanicum]|uniref:Peptidyl-prolyl cis-trans isomerase n=1 Tax=Quisquiliibacterium transsilvanicum TaxID=1549638 RepID=A0A7W8HKD8_9BURK|nr:peptidyl-prolyl cis-trans isomerase A (cyclophilin A) [Quisquiliibacterium transsilvanicum]